MNLIYCTRADCRHEPGTCTQSPGLVSEARVREIVWEELAAGQPRPRHDGLPSETICDWDPDFPPAQDC